MFQIITTITKLFEPLHREGMLRNFSLLASGTGLAQLIAIASSPITRRLYSENEYGVFSLIISLSAIVASISMGRYEMAIMVPKTDRDAHYLSLLSIVLVTITSVLLVPLVFLSSDWLVSNLSKETQGWLLLLPLYVLLNGVYKVLFNYSNRIKDYPGIARSELTKASALAAFTIGIGFAFPSSAVGLILGGAVASAIAISMLVKRIRGRETRPSWRIENLVTVAKKYKKFPMLSACGGLAKVMSDHLFDIFISIGFSLAILGQ